MTLFAYRAARPDGALVRGELDGLSRTAAAAALSRRGLLPLSVEPAATLTRWRARPPARAQATVFRSLACLLDAGVPLQEGLDVTRRITRGALSAAIERASNRVREGQSLAAALGAEASTFSPVAVGLVRGGERGTGLAPALSEAAVHLERAADLSARLRAALTYPAVLGVVGAASLAVILLVLVPRFVGVLGPAVADAPVATRALIGLSTGARRYGVPVALCTAVITGLAARAASRRRVDWHRWLLAAPVLGRIRLQFASARACRTLGALLATGTPALAALEAVHDTLGDRAVGARLSRARDRVAEGATLSRALAAYDVLTPSALQLAEIGDRAGRLPDLLAKAADLDEDLAERELHSLISLLEPALIVAFAAVVAFVAAALLQAIYSVRPGAW